MTLTASAPIALDYSYFNEFTSVWSINDEDEVAGSNSAGGVVWQSGHVTSLPGLPGDQSGLAAWANSQGQVVGYSYTGTFYNPVLWQNGVATSLPTLGSSGRVYDMSSQGVIVGSAEDSKGLAVAVEIVNGTVIQLGQLPGGYQAISGLAVSRAFSINDQGQIVGISLNSMGVQQAVLWQNGTVTELGSFSEGIESFAYKINDHGVAVGFAEDSNGIDQAVYWQNGVMTVLQDHQSNGHSIAYGINDAGIIVGRSDLYTITTGWQDDAVVWQNGLLIDLNSFLPANSGWVLNVARSINDNGEIAGMGTYNGVTTAFTLSIGDSSGPMMSAANALQDFKATPHGAAISVLDSAADITANLDGLQGIASVGKLLQIRLSDSAALTLTSAQATTDAAALANLSGSYSLHLTQETVSSATTLLQQPHVTGVGITDTAYSIGGSLDQLESWAADGQLIGITVTGPLPILDVTAQQVTDDSLVLKDIQASYQLQISGATVAQIVAFSADYSLASPQIVDSIDNAASGVGQLAALHLDSYSLSLSGTAADLAAHWDTLESLGRVGYVNVTVTDTDFPTIPITAAQYSRDFVLQGTFVLAVDLSQEANYTISPGLGGASVVAVFPDPVSDYALSTWSGDFLEVQDTGTGRTSADYLQVTAVRFADGTDFVVQAPSATGVTSGNVAELYAAVLARTPDVAGVAFYEQLIQGGNPPSMVQLAEYFLNSPEYLNNPAHAYAQSADGDARFITDTYQNLLHRTPDSGAVPFYQKVIDQFTAGLTPGTAAYATAQMQGHAQVLVYFSASAEFLGDVQITSQHPADAQHWLYVI